MDFKIVNSNLFICDRWGNTSRRISENCAFGTYDEVTKTFLVTKNDGKLELKDINGNLQRVVSLGVLEARFSGKEIIVRKKDGKTCVIDRVGNILRFI